MSGETMSRRERMHENKVNRVYDGNLTQTMAEYHGNGSPIKTSSCVFSNKRFELSDRIKDNRVKPRKEGLAKDLTDFGMTVYRAFKVVLDPAYKN